MALAFRSLRRCFLIQTASLRKTLVTAQKNDAISAFELLTAKYSQCASHGAIAPFASSVRATGGRENRFMKKNVIEYTKDEIGAVKIIKDFLPHPSELVLKDDNVKVTLRLSRRSIEFFKREAKKQSVPYQKMIRALVDGYAERVGK